VYLVVIGWLYVVMMMAVAEATNTTGTVLGAIVTFVLYGVVPIVLVIYIMRTPQRRKERKAREAAEDQARRESTVAPTQVTSGEPNAGSHAPGAAESDSVAPVRKEV
jgi:large-conductance mechanosensitive channel